MNDLNEKMIEMRVKKVAENMSIKLIPASFNNELTDPPQSRAFIRSDINSKNFHFTGFRISIELFIFIFLHT